jgi:hypothetical protein
MEISGESSNVKRELTAQLIDIVSSGSSQIPNPKFLFQPLNLSTYQPINLSTQEPETFIFQADNFSSICRWQKI